MPRTLSRTAFQKRAHVTVLAAGLVCAAAACNGSGGNGQRTPTTVATPGTVAASPSAPAIPSGDTPPNAQTPRSTTAAAFTEAEVGGIAPPAEDVARLLKLPLVTRDVRRGLGQDFEGVDLERFGFVDGWTVFYRVGAADPAMPEGASIEFAFLDTTEHAASTLAGVSGVVGLQPDEAGAIPGSHGEPTLSGIVMRKGRVVATIFGLHAEGVDIVGGLRELAALVAQHLAAFESSTP